MIIHKALFLSIKNYISIYVKAIAVECKDTVRHFLCKPKDVKNYIRAK